MYNKVFMYAYARMGPPLGGAALYIKAAARATQLCHHMHSVAVLCTYEES